MKKSGLILNKIYQVSEIKRHLLFLTFLRSRGGSLRALMIKEEADGTTDT